jgi:hypothetical protein
MDKFYEENPELKVFEDMRVSLITLLKENDMGGVKKILLENMDNPNRGILRTILSTIKMCGVHRHPYLIDEFRRMADILEAGRIEKMNKGINS